jgi:ELP3 family radical SAM enzyme/protein acetyltransferase
MYNIKNAKDTKDIEDIKNIKIAKPYNFINKPIELTKIVNEMIGRNIINKRDMTLFIKEMQKKYKMPLSTHHILYIYRVLVKDGRVGYDKKFEVLLRKKISRSQSGVIVVAVFTSPYPKSGKKMSKFSCKYDCYYCPNEPGQPRSYLLNEPGVLRANRNNFDAVQQFMDRANTYIVMGHPVDKIELLVLGGTWSSYPPSYQEEFIRDCYYAANTFYDAEQGTRGRKSVDDEILINETGSCRIIGLTLETRPDNITPKELIRFRKFGVTRVQLGVQHTDNRILYRVNRMCTTERTIQALKLLKDNCFKIDIHLMPDLPAPLKDGISNKHKQFEIEDIDESINMVDLDKKMFNDVLYNPDLQADQWKIYPCEVVPWTRIKDEHERKVYKPYGETPKLFELILYVKKNIHPWIRLNRIIRDIPNSYISGGNQNTNMRQYLIKEMKEKKITCSCIRCREVKNKDVDYKDAKIVVRQYNASKGVEYFISFEGKNELLFGFLRLRLCNDAGYNINKNNIPKPVFEELMGTALIRELHVYGQVIKVDNTDTSKTQHRGFGRKLLERAEKISSEHGYDKIAVIAGVGTREYYRKYKYENHKYFMIKKIIPTNQKSIRNILYITCIIFAIYFCIYVCKY